MARCAVVKRVVALLGTLLALVMLGEFATASSAQALDGSGFTNFIKSIPSGMEGIISDAGALTGVEAGTTTVGATSAGGTTAVAAGGTASVPLDGLLLAGAGSFLGTCWVLGHVVTDNASGCKDGAANIVNGTLFSYLFGTNGDNRYTYTGTAGVIGTTGYAGAATPSFTVNIGGLDQTVSWYVKVEYVTQAAPTTVCGIAEVGHTRAPGGSFTVYQGAGGIQGSNTYTSMKSAFSAYNTNADVNSAQYCTGTLFVKDVLLYNLNIGLARTYTFDTGTGSPWTVKASETCVTSSGQTATASQTATYTPVAGLPTPGVVLPKCDDVLPGSHLQSANYLGGRAGITAPNPDVNVTVGGASSAAQTSYPLCTTQAPAGGCHLDVQKAGKSCFSSGVYCAGWLNNETRWGMSCEWGPYDLAISVCETDYGHLFDTETQGIPGQEPSAGTGPSTGPGTGVDPGPDSSTAPDPTGNPSDDSGACDGAFGSFSVKAWVEQPIECAMEKMFAPRTPPSFTDLPSPLPVGWLPSIPTLTDSTCGVVTIPAFTLGAGPVKHQYGPYTLFDTCKQPWPQARAVSYYGVLTLISISAVFRALYMVMNGLGLAVQADAAFTDFALRDLGNENDVL